MTQTTNDNTAIIRYVDAAEGERYWRIDRMGLVLSRKAMDRHVTEFVSFNGFVMQGEVFTEAACQWPSRNVIYRRWEP